MRALVATAGISLLLLGAAPAGAKNSGPKRAVIRAVKNFQYPSGDLRKVQAENYCGLMTPYLRNQYAEMLRMLVDTPSIDCVQGLKAFIAAWPYQLPDPGLTTSSSKKTMRSLDKSQVMITGTSARLIVHYRGPGCKRSRFDFWSLRYINGRWLIDSAGPPAWPCFSRPASQAEAAGLRAAVSRQLQALEQRNAQAYCDNTDVFELRLASWFLGSNMDIFNFHFDCLSFIRQELFKYKVEDDAQRYARALNSARWRVLDYGAQSIVFVDNRKVHLNVYNLGGGQWRPGAVSITIPR